MDSNNIIIIISDVVDSKTSSDGDLKSKIVQRRLLRGKGFPCILPKSK